jgi:hypothetical protein
MKKVIVFAVIIPILTIVSLFRLFQIAKAVDSEKYEEDEVYGI